MPLMLSNSEVLTAAAELIERNGKCKGHLYAFYGEDGAMGTLADRPMCALGAIGYVSTGHPSGYRASWGALQLLLRSEPTLRRLLGRPIGQQASYMAAWSDSRDADTVVSCLRKAADLERADR